MERTAPCKTWKRDDKKNNTRTFREAQKRIGYWRWALSQSKTSVQSSDILVRLLKGPGSAQKINEPKCRIYSAMYCEQKL
jgi:hypothetical protein